jgi:Domain of unknown function (DUF4145)
METIMPQVGPQQDASRECPYCGIRFSIDGVGAYHSGVHFESPHKWLHGGHSRTAAGEKEFTISCHRCPDCGGQVIWLNELGPRPEDPDKSWDVEIVATTLLYPRWARRAVPKATPQDIAAEYQEAFQVLDVSPKASAALARRCLQNVIRKQENIEERTLYEEIQRLLATKKLPRYLADDLDAIRVVGNFAAHPIKNTNTGEVVPVEPQEAEWTLDLLTELLDFYFEREVKSTARRSRLQAKLNCLHKR